MAAGRFCVSDGGYYSKSAGKYLINLEDRRNLAPHHDSRRLNGCCGLDGQDGLNQVCACGAEVATECSDCWMAHALIFESDAVDAVDVP